VPRRERPLESQGVRSPAPSTGVRHSALNPSTCSTARWNWPAWRSSAPHRPARPTCAACTGVGGQVGVDGVVRGGTVGRHPGRTVLRDLALAEQNDRIAFTDVVAEQLAELLAEPAPEVTPATRDLIFHHLLDRAAEICASGDERLVLLVDGLDEDRGAVAAPNSNSNTALLPSPVSPGLRVIVSGRRHHRSQLTCLPSIRGATRRSCGTSSRLRRPERSARTCCVSWTASSTTRPSNESSSAWSPVRAVVWAQGHSRADQAAEA
jgi:hypothetical protein